MFRNVCKSIKKLKLIIYISLQTLYSVLCWSTFGSEHSDYWVWCYKLGTPVFGEFLPFFSADPLKLCQVGWGVSLHSYFLVSPGTFNWVQVRALAGPIKVIQRLVRKPLLHCLGCVLRVVVLFEGEPSPQRSWALWRWHSEDGAGWNGSRLTAA